METLNTTPLESSRTLAKRGMYCEVCEFGTNMPDLYCHHLIARAQRKRPEAKRKIGCASPELFEGRNPSADRTRVLAECACGASVWTKRPKFIL